MDEPTTQDYLKGVFLTDVDRGKALGRIMFRGPFVLISFLLCWTLNVYIFNKFNVPFEVVLGMKPGKSTSSMLSV